jgi:hypothetical protein
LWAKSFEQKNTASGLFEIQNAITRNILTAVGGYHGAGEFDRGFKLLNDSIEYNPFFPWWFKVGFVFYSLYKKEYQQAYDWAEKIDMPELLWGPNAEGKFAGTFKSHRKSSPKS